MSDTIKGFFKKYHAVRANDAGPDWKSASEEALLGWFNKLAPVVRCGWDFTAKREVPSRERRTQLKLYEEVAAEVIRRADLPRPSGAIVGAAMIAREPFPIPLR